MCDCLLFVVCGCVLLAARCSVLFEVCRLSLLLYVVCCGLPFGVRSRSFVVVGWGLQCLAFVVCCVLFVVWFSVFDVRCCFFFVFFFGGCVCVCVLVVVCCIVIVVVCCGSLRCCVVVERCCCALFVVGWCVMVEAWCSLCVARWLVFVVRGGLFLVCCVVRAMC